MNVMVIDGGGRGQALAHKLAPECENLFVSPGNPGNEAIAGSTGIETSDIGAQLRFAKRNKIDLTIAANDDPLADGIVDEFQADHQAIFGPTKAQARIEWDKNFAKELGRNLCVPMGPYSHFTNGAVALDYAQTYDNWPLFVKDNNLAQGKGVTRCENIEAFEMAIHGLREIIVEDYVAGLEASHHAFCDGKIELSIPILARDHKTVGKNDTGPMTGGMGTVSPLPEYTLREARELGETFAAPIVKALGFKGLLFSGLKGAKGWEQNIEWNARGGDPETQVFMRLMKSRLLPVLFACNEGSLDQLPQPTWDLGSSAVCLVLAAEGYPQAPKNGALIEGIEDAVKVDGVQVLHAGTKKRGSQLVVNGGRALNVVSQAETLPLAIDRAYIAARYISFDGRAPVTRPDIGQTTLRG